MTADTDVVSVDALAALIGVQHGFFTRNGGASSGIYGSNNCAFGSNDSRDDVAHNRGQCVQHLNASNLVTVYQRHTADVVTVEAPWPWDKNPVADALVTALPGIAIGILTADCTPVLLADEKACVIGAAHAGWRGAFDGILENTIKAMIKLGASPERIVAAVGPCIAQTSYEVGPEFAARFVERDPAFARYFTAPKANGHVHFDLPQFTKDRLAAAGVGTIAVQGSDTCANDDSFFSYRRSALRGEADYGRQLSAISLDSRCGV
jgi:polyphenol oxidase